MHILIVDDCDLFREGLVSLLHECLQNVTVLEADCVASAAMLTKQHHHTIDLVLLDHELPDGMGVSLLAEMRVDYTHLSIAILSAWEDPELMLAGGVYIPPSLLSYIPADISTNVKSVSEKERLTERQFEVLTLLRAGLSNKIIGRELSISKATVKAHVTIILRTCGVSSRTQLQPPK